MTDKKFDPNLQAPQEANTTKHINFLEADESDAAGVASSADSTEDDSPTKKAWEELRKEQKSEGASND